MRSYEDLYRAIATEHGHSEPVFRNLPWDKRVVAALLFGWPRLALLLLATLIPASIIVYFSDGLANEKYILDLGLKALFLEAPLYAVPSVIVGYLVLFLFVGVVCQSRTYCLEQFFLKHSINQQLTSDIFMKIEEGKQNDYQLVSVPDERFLGIPLGGTRQLNSSDWDKLSILPFLGPFSSLLAFGGISYRTARIRLKDTVSADVDRSVSAAKLSIKDILSLEAVRLETLAKNVRRKYRGESQKKRAMVDFGFRVLVRAVKLRDCNETFNSTADLAKAICLAEGWNGTSESRVSQILSGKYSEFFQKII